MISDWLIRSGNNFYDYALQKNTFCRFFITGFNTVLRWGVYFTGEYYGLNLVTHPTTYCEVEGVAFSATHAKIITANIYFGEGFNWFFNSLNTAPVLTAIGNQLLTEADVLLVPIFASDAEGDALTFCAIGLPSFASLINHHDRIATLTISPQIGEGSSTSITLAVVDTGNPVLSDEGIFEIIVLALDTDNDNISDYDEIYMYGTSAIEADTDTDGDDLEDYQETFVYLTSSIDGDNDNDNDFIGDGVEVANGSNLLDTLDWLNLADGSIYTLG